MKYLVTKKRFLHEHKNHVVNIPGKHVNWRMTEDCLEMYIDALGVNATYCYFHYGSLTPEIENMISDKGEILDILNDYEKDDNSYDDIVISSLNRIEGKVTKQ